MRLPYSFQRFALNERGELLLPSSTLDELLSSEPHARLTDRGRRIEVHLPDEVVSIPVRLTPGEPAAHDPRLDPFEIETWVGVDGRRAQVVWMDGRPELRARR